MSKSKKVQIVKVSEKVHLVKIKLDVMKGRKFTTSEIGRGIGVHKTFKGKGSYTRKPKHKGKAKAEW